MKGKDKNTGKIAREKIRVKLLKRQQKEIHTLMEENVRIYYIAMQLNLNVSPIRYFIQNEIKEELS